MLGFAGIVDPSILFMPFHILTHVRLTIRKTTAILLLIDEFSQSVPAYKHASLDSKQSMWPCLYPPPTLAENNDKVLWVCAHAAIN